MNTRIARQFRKLEVGVRSPAEALGFSSDSLGGVGQSRSLQVGVCPDSVTTETPVELPALSVADAASRWVGRHDVIARRLAAQTLVSPCGCWLWTGRVDATGYARIQINHDREPVHRLRYIPEHRTLPVGMMVCHRCDVRRCSRPDHLFLGTHDDNMRDMRDKGRDHPPFGQNHWSARIDEEAARWVRESAGRVPAREAARVLGVSRWTIFDIRRGRRWKHLARSTESAVAP